MRIDKVLANSGYGTRSGVKDMIAAGMVRVNGNVVKDPGLHVSDSDEISVDGVEFDRRDYLYYVFDKPDEVLTAMEDKRYKCVGDFIPGDLKGKHLSPVGRLDYHTTGLLIITNDGELNHKLTSPRYGISKQYKVEYQGGCLPAEAVRELAAGITLTDMDKPVKIAPCTLEITDDHTCILTLTEGKTHEVRRIISHYGRQVVTLRRIAVGGLTLDEEAPGKLRPLSKEEIELLMRL